MHDFHFCDFYMLIRKVDGHIYVDRGKYKYFVAPDEIGRGDRIKVYSDENKLPSWAHKDDVYEIKKIEINITVTCDKNDSSKGDD